MGRAIVKNMAGQTFGRLFVLNDFYIKNNGAYWLCQCSCGVKKYIIGNSLRSGNSASCGCATREIATNSFTTHGLSDHPLYTVHRNINRRCSNPAHKSYKDYGGRGIKVCEEWKKDFLSFYHWCINNGWQKGLDIDRKDNDKDYGPDNCRFVTRKKNMYNRRCSLFVEYGGKKCSVDELELVAGIPARRIKHRIINGWDVEDAIKTPVGKCNSRINHRKKAA